MSSNLTTSLRPHKLPGSIVRALLCSLVSLLLLYAPPSSSAQQPTSPSATPANITAAKSPENQPPSTGKAGTDAAHTGSITGRVLADDGHPLMNAVISVFTLGVSGPPAGNTTDAEGQFQLKDLRPAAYILQATAPGYVLMPDAGAEFGGRRFYHIGESVTLTMVKGGVITGTVTNAAGEPVVATSVRAVRVRKPSEQRTGSFNFSRDRMTDDRGVYRLYGLEPGVYLIAAGGSAQSFGNLNANDGDAPTYYPSATRDTAAELTVHAGEELTGIDVRYRGERGHTISGFVSGNINDGGTRFSGVPITLLRTATATTESFAFINGDENNRSFAINGIADGEYTLTATRTLNPSESLMAIRKVSVRGGDVTGVELKLEPLASITGNALLEPPPKADCPNQRSAALQEIVIAARPNEQEQTDENALSSFFRRMYAAPNDKGEFKLTTLRSGSYRLDVQLPTDDWFVRSMAMPGAASTTAKAAAQSKAVQPGSLTLKSGERITGVTVTIGQGAASLRGRVVSVAEGASLPAGLRVYLVPMETERVADPLRYMEAAVERDAVFALNKIAPGRYWLITRVDAVNESEKAERPAVALESAERIKLRREAESRGAKIDLQPCQRLADYVLNYGPTPKQPAVK